MSYGTEWIVVGALLAAVALVGMPWLALVVLAAVLVVAVAALGAFVVAVVAIPYALVRSLHRRWRRRGAADERQVLHRPLAASTERK